MDGGREMPGREVMNQLLRSGCLDQKALISVSGGEPFLRSDLAETLAMLLQHGLEYSVLLSTNGTLPQRVEELLQTIGDPSRLYIAVSLDGLENTHNKIRENKQAFQLAVETIKIICAYSVDCHVNTVVQAENLAELDQLAQIIKQISDNKAKITYIPVIEEITRVAGVAPSDMEDMRRLIKYAQAPKDIKRIASGGRPLLEGCHGGERNIVISPGGRVFTCQTKVCWKYDDCFCLGDLRTDSLSSVLNSTQADRARAAARICGGCSMPCDVDREERLFGLSFALTEQEADYWHSLTEEPIAFISGWYQNERENGIFRWMSEKRALLYIKNEHATGMSISIENYYPKNSEHPMRLTITCAGNTSKHVCKSGGDCIKLNIAPGLLKIIFEVDKMWSPAIYDSKDTRNLGVAVTGIQMGRG
jgi:MoaA/NifB/PqqE/SkfB family radical SAM enzyme